MFFSRGQFERICSHTINTPLRPLDGPISGFRPCLCPYILRPPKSRYRRFTILRDDKKQRYSLIILTYSRQKSGKPCKTKNTGNGYAKRI